MSEYHCISGPTTDKLLVPEHPIIFVATAQAREPVFVTSGAYLIRRDDGIPDVRIEIYTWEPGGATAASKLVKWFCRFPTHPPIF